MSLDALCCIGRENNITKWKKSRREKKWSNIVPAPGLRHLILVGEFGCQGNRASSIAEVLKYIFYEIV